MFIDTHCHLSDKQFDPDREAIVWRALAAQVSTLIEIGDSPDIWEAAVALAERHPFVYAGLGIHPHHAHQAGPAEWPALEKRLRALLRHPKVVAVGEFGLDYYRMRNTQEQQDFLFHRQLSLAKELDKPVIIHCREADPSPAPGRSAHADIQRAIAEFFPEKDMALECQAPMGVVHCFSGAWSDAQIYMQRGFLLGIDAPLTYPSAKGLQQNVLRMPLQRLLLETDSPYLPPQTHRGQRNEPAHIPAIAEAVAALKRLTTEAVARQTTQNARRLFRLSDA